jgi:hypothetical protein
MAIPPHQRFFFIHVMKTGGSSFTEHIRANFEPDSIFPDKTAQSDSIFSLFSIQNLLNLPPERTSHIQAYMGHFPYTVTELLTGDFITLTLLRDPVERTISYLKHCKRFHKEYRNLSLQEIYEDPVCYPRFIHDYQTRIFSMTPQDVPKRLTGLAAVWLMSPHRPDLLPAYWDIDTSFNRIEVDEKRLARAKENLAKVDVLGLTEQFDAFLKIMRKRFNWRITSQPKMLASPNMDVSYALRRRIAEENPMDLAFYEYAQQLYWQQHAPDSST